MKRKKFFKCPDCGHLGVYYKYGQIAGEDSYTCRNRDCGFFAFISGSDAFDWSNRAKLRQMNPNGSAYYGEVAV